MADSAAKNSDLQVVAAPAIEKRIFGNAKRFPADFMFQLSKAETEALRSQIVISKVGRGGRRYEPYVFTEQGVAMLSGVLRSDRAIAVNIEIMRREHDEQLRQIFEALRQLIAPPPSTKRPIGFRVRGGDE